LRRCRKARRSNNEGKPVLRLQQWKDGSQGLEVEEKVERKWDVWC
jgi:hypothetical protein